MEKSNLTHYWIFPFCVLLKVKQVLERIDKQWQFSFLDELNFYSSDGRLMGRLIGMHRSHAESGWVQKKRGGVRGAWWRFITCHASRSQWVWTVCVVCAAERWVFFLSLSSTNKGLLSSAGSADGDAVVRGPLCSQCTERTTLTSSGEVDKKQLTDSE